MPRRSFFPWYLAGHKGVHGNGNRHHSCSVYKFRRHHRGSRIICPSACKSRNPQLCHIVQIHRVALMAAQELNGVQNQLPSSDSFWLTVLSSHPSASRLRRTGEAGSEKMTNQARRSGSSTFAAGVWPGTKRPSSSPAWLRLTPLHGGPKLFMIWALPPILHLRSASTVSSFVSG